MNDFWPVIEVLTAYIRVHAPWEGTRTEGASSFSSSKQQKMVEQSNPKPREDIQTILSVIGGFTRPLFEKGEGKSLNLAGTDLRGANLAGAHLEKANLTAAHLEKANLRGAHLEKATLYKAHMQEAKLIDSHLEEADLVEANLCKAEFFGANLQRANLKEAALIDSHLEGQTSRKPGYKEQNSKELTCQGLTSAGQTLRKQKASR
jgi:uncharacterized protein YjbI with pentapeptide repeats